MACRRLASQYHSASESSNVNVASSSYTVGTEESHWKILSVIPTIRCYAPTQNHQMEVGGQNVRCPENTPVSLRSDQYQSAILHPCGLKPTVGDSWVLGKTSYHITTQQAISTVLPIGHQVVIRSKEMLAILAEAAIANFTHRTYCNDCK